MDKNDQAWAIRARFIKLVQAFTDEATARRDDEWWSDHGALRTGSPAEWLVDKYSAEYKEQGNELALKTLPKLLCIRIDIERITGKARK